MAYGRFILWVYVRVICTLTVKEKLISAVICDWREKSRPSNGLWWTTYFRGGITRLHTYITCISFLSLVSFSNSYFNSHLYFFFFIAAAFLANATLHFTTNKTFEPSIFESNANPCPHLQRPGIRCHYPDVSRFTVNIRWK